MTIVKYIMVVLGLLGAILSVAYKLPSYGTHGILVLVACLIPAALGALGTFAFRGMPRWASILSALAFIVAMMKTRQGDDLQNIMLVAAAGFLAAIALAIRPDRPRARQVQTGSAAQ
jgi:hypothetical protein